MLFIDALLKTRRSLEAAERSFDRMQSATNLAEIEDHWEAILYSLAQVAKTLAPLKVESKLTHILQKMVLDRRGGDPLVTYVYEARNAKDHGLKPVTIPKSASTVFGSTSGQTVIEYAQFGNVTIENLRVSGATNALVFEASGADTTDLHLGAIYDPSGRGQIFINRTAEHLQLVAVSSERTGLTYPAPSSHMGSPVASDVCNVADLALNYYMDKFDQIIDTLGIN